MISNILDFFKARGLAILIGLVAGYIAYLQVQINLANRRTDKAEQAITAQKQQFKKTLDSVNRVQVENFTVILSASVDNMRNQIQQSDSSMFLLFKQYNPEKTKQLTKSYQSWQQRFQQSRQP